MMLLLPLPGHAGMIAGLCCAKGHLRHGLVKEGRNYSQQLFGVRTEHEVASTGDNGKLRVWNQPRNLQRVLDRKVKVMITSRDEDWCLNGSQFVLRKTLPLHPPDFGEQLGPVRRVWCHTLVALARKLERVGIRGNVPAANR